MSAMLRAVMDGINVARGARTVLNYQAQLLAERARLPGGRVSSMRAQPDVQSGANRNSPGTWKRPRRAPFAAGNRPQNVTSDRSETVDGAPSMARDDGARRDRSSPKDSRSIVNEPTMAGGAQEASMEACALEASRRTGVPEGNSAIGQTPESIEQSSVASETIVGAAADASPPGGESVSTLASTLESGPTASRASSAHAADGASSFPSSEPKHTNRERRVPSSGVSRAMSFGSLGVQLLGGAASEAGRRLWGGSGDSQTGSVYMSQRNADRIASSLSRMRGAALKIGQMLSIQDENMLPPQLSAALERVRQSADYMPQAQLKQVMESELGASWEGRFREFDMQPFAAASIGQVHRAVTGEGEKVAVKVQYPGVAESIDSDIRNLRRVISFAGVVPRSFYVEDALAHARNELAEECDYLAEARKQNRYREMMLGDERFFVPRALTHLSSRRVLTSDWASGEPVDHFGVRSGASQQQRNYLGSTLMELTLHELFAMRFLQSDPNFSNFFYDGKTLSLLDFGAARTFRRAFVRDYLRMVRGCAERDREQVLYYSQRLGFLTGEESRVMLDAHVAASFIVGEPFQADKQPYDFSCHNVAGRAAKHARTLAEHRLKPPPTEVYSLHRRLSGAFLLCVRLGAVVPGRELLLNVYDRFVFEEDEVGDRGDGGGTEKRVDAGVAAPAVANESSQSS